ncbi:MAG TPA: cytochrome-c oxidase, cbb3-type subunit III [Xanthomonadales bacterium]|nr:cytochrome-c oxidase, cbb3-type subunit III [Xanthomonadales bacterium]
MSAFWSWFIIVLVVVNVVGCLWLLWFTGRRRPDLKAGAQTGHVWDGDLREYNNPLPKWWINLFYITIVFTIGYLVWYPGLGAFKGIGDWTSSGEHDAAVAAAREKLEPVFARFEGKSVAELATDPDALELGRSVFANTCATCHGSDARGAKGFPNLVDRDWQWGEPPDVILTSVLHGRQAAMPALAPALGSDQAVTETVVYVQSLSGQKVDPALAAAGKPRFEMLCAACHTPAGTGNPILGAPDLSDDIWLYGGDFESIRTAIVQGRNGQMPAFGPLLGDTRSRLVSAWVYAQSQADAAQEAQP